MEAGHIDQANWLNLSRTCQSCFWLINIMKKKLQGCDNITQKQQFIQGVTNSF